MTSSAPPLRRLEATDQRDLTLERYAWMVLTVAVIASAVLVYCLTRGSSFSSDDWQWITTRRANSLHTFLAPYNGHLSLVPIALYRLMFALVGIGNFADYRLLLLAVAAASGLVVFAYVRQRLGDFAAALVAALMLFLGPGWNDIVQPFQIAWLIAVAAAILALALLERRRTGCDALACVLVLVALSSTSVGVALSVGIAVDVAVARRRWRDAWIAGGPLVLYALWALHYHPSQISLSAVTGAPVNLLQTTGGAIAGVGGLSAATPFDLTGLMLTAGASLLVLAAGAVFLRGSRDWDAGRFLSLAVSLLTFSLLTTLARSFQSPFESRYMYVTCVLVTLMGVELARGMRVTLPVKAALAALTLVAVVSSVGVLRSGASFFRAIGSQADATFGAVALDQSTVGTQTPVALYPLGAITAGQYFAAARALGTPAFTVTELQHTDPAAQSSADAQFRADGDVRLVGATVAPAATGPAATVLQAAGGTAVTAGACVAFTPAGALGPGESSLLAVRLGPGRVSVTAGGQPVNVSVRRFAPSYAPLGAVAPHRPAIISVLSDRAPQPWQLEISSAAALRVCTVGAA